MPFFVLPSTLAKDVGMQLGDLAVAYRRSTDKMAPAIFADLGPTWGLGEGSMALHRQLGNEPVRPYKGGPPRAKFGISARDVTFLLFPGSSVGTFSDPAQWQRVAQEKATVLLDAWGGQQKLETCAQ